jgi:hypothetical protein
MINQMDLNSGQNEDRSNKCEFGSKWRYIKLNEILIKRRINQMDLNAAHSMIDQMNANLNQNEDRSNETKFEGKKDQSNGSEFGSK